MLSFSLFYALLQASIYLSKNKSSQLVIFPPVGVESPVCLQSLKFCAAVHVLKSNSFRKLFS